MPPPSLERQQVQFNRVLLQVLRPGLRWLEIGCGHSSFDKELPVSEWQPVLSSLSLAVGVDNHFASLRRNREMPARVCADAVALPFRDGTFDLVSANMLAQHLPDPVAVLREIARVLRPGGKFLFQTTNTLNYQIALSRLANHGIQKSLTGWLEHRPADEVYRLYHQLNGQRQIEKCARTAGFCGVEIRYADSPGVLHALGPLRFIETISGRVLEHNSFRRYRRNLIVTLQLPSAYQREE